MELSALVQAGVTNVGSGAVAQPTPAQTPVAVPARDPVQPAEPSVVQTAQPSRKEVEQAARQIQEFLKHPPASLEFFLDDQSGRFLLRIVDVQTRQVLRETPSEELLLAIARALDRVQGPLVSANA